MSTPAQAVAAGVPEEHVDDILSATLDEWKRDIDRLLPFYGERDEVVGETPISRAKDCLSALDNTNQLLQSLAKVAELQSAQSDLAQLHNTIDILSGLRQDLAKITREEVMRSKRDTETRKANATARRVSMAAPPRNGNAHRSEKSVTGTPQPNGSHKTTSASATLPARSTSVRANTGPRAELPGEAISRRKREAIEAKRRADEEEARRKREFKARPAPHSSNSTSHPRETISSRARQAKALLAENNAPQQSSDAAPTANKRHSMAIQPQSRPPLATTTSSTSQGAAAAGTAPRSRGRDTATAPILHSPALSRNASSSAGSAHGSRPRSTVSAEEAAQQKLRGRDIYVRDNSFSAERDRERREREEAARLARLEAAERSRQLSREWAEKQRGGGGK